MAGWAVSGDEENIKAPILYVTDGLLKERLLYDENLICDEITASDKPLIFMIDEVHERSVNIDLCLALFARLLTEKPKLAQKMKLIISSATLDTSVPDLFRKIPGFDQFEMPKKGSLFQVEEFQRPNENAVKLVLELYEKRQGEDQILCFVSNALDVHRSCKLFKQISNNLITAYPLVQTQSSTQQQKFIEEGTVFFSTTVAETSLTFPTLRYVVDTGKINLPVYDVKLRQTVLQEQRASESTVKQRRGRVGRTKEGEYHALYDFKVKEQLYPIPQICQTDLTNVEFSIRKSPLGYGLHTFKQYLPNSPAKERIDAAIDELKMLGKIFSFVERLQLLKMLP